MGEIDAKLSEQFLAWERRGRGWDVYSQPVEPEPPFRPFAGRELPTAAKIDDGRKPTRASAWVQSLGRRLAGTTAPASVPHLDDDEPAPATLEREPLSELLVLLPQNFNPRRETFEQWLASLAFCREPFAFEIQGTADAITVRLAVHPADAPMVQQQMQTFFPEVPCMATEGELARAWESCGDSDAAVIEFGLAEPFMRPLASGKFEPFVGLAGALSNLRSGEIGLYQVLFQPVQHKWSENIIYSVTQADGRAFFVNAPELAAEANHKTARPLYAAVLRLATRAPEFERTWEIARHLAGALRVFAHPNANELIPLRNDRYPFDAHIADVLRRQSRRTGMLLNLDELLGLVHFPTGEVRSPKLLRQTAKSKQAPETVGNAEGRFLGWNIHFGNKRGVWLTEEQRVRHTHIIGASGTGKSTLLFNLIREDIESGEGVAVLDPHGDLVDQVMGIIPQERIDDVILLDPADENFSVGFNILSAHSDLEKTLLASDLVSIFQRLSTSWGDQMGSVLNNAILAFLESTEGGTLADLRRFLLEPSFREQVLKTVRDPDIVYYWRKGFSQLSGNKSIGPVLTRLETFLSPKPIRYMVSQKVNRLDFAHILDSGKIFLAKLSRGAIGEENSFLLGSLLMAKFQQTAMSRQRQEAAARRAFWLYLDEFHHFITPSMTEILTGARKYRVGLTLAHHELRQLQRDAEVASAVMSNCYTRVCFRVGDQDARALESGFSSFDARDLQNLSTGEAVCRVERSDFDFNLKVPLLERPDDASAAERRRLVATASRKKYAVARADIEAALRAHAEPSPVARTDTATQAPKQPKAPPTNKLEPKVEMPPPEPAQPPAADHISPTPVSKPALMPADLGRGGAQHKAIQSRIKDGAEALGFRVFVEKPILDGAGSVDLVLQRDGATIACEITVTTTIDHEIGNVSKCVKAGFPQVALVAVTDDKLAKLKAAVSTSFGPDIAARVTYFLPDAFLADLKKMAPAPAGLAPSAKKVRGYKVKTTYEQLSPDEAQAKEDDMIKMMAEMMRRKPPSKKP